MSAVDRAPRRAHGAAGAELGAEPPRQAAGKRSRSEGAAEEAAPSAELEAEEAGDGGAEEPGTAEHAGDWDLSFELLSALGLERADGEGAKDGEGADEAAPAPMRRKATAAAWAAPPAADLAGATRPGAAAAGAAGVPQEGAVAAQLAGGADPKGGMEGDPQGRLSGRVTGRDRTRQAAAARAAPRPHRPGQSARPRQLRFCHQGHSRSVGGERSCQTPEPPWQRDQQRAAQRRGPELSGSGDRRRRVQRILCLLAMEDVLERGRPQPGHAEQPRRQRALQYLAARGASRRAVVSGRPLCGWPCLEDARRPDRR